MTELLPKPVFRLLRNVRRNWRKRKTDWAFDGIRKAKQKAVAADAEPAAKRFWVYEAILRLQDRYIDFYRKARERNFYRAWCSLEEAEITLLNLRAHCEIGDEFALALMQKLIPQFQDIFPYAAFFSPELVIRKRKCSICGKRVTALRGCRHTKGEIYGGEICCHVIEAADFLAISIVTNPVQKYSVPFAIHEGTESQDNYDYGLVDYVISGLLTPFADWDHSRTSIRHPHSRFLKVSPQDECPCESGMPYEQCCLHNPDGVLRPHFKIRFHEEPPASLPRFEYASDRVIRGERRQPVRSSRRIVTPLFRADQEM